MVTLLFLHAQWDHGLFASRLFDQLILGTPLVAINILGITVYTYDQLFWREFGWTGLVAVLFWMTIVLIWFVTLLS